MKKRFNKNTSLHKMSCCGCGRHEKLVGMDVVAYFCNHCFLSNGNYNRYKQGLQTFKPLSNIKVKDELVGADGEVYIVTGRGVAQGEDKLYPVRKKDSKEVNLVGDWFFVKKNEVADI